MDKITITVDGKKLELSPEDFIKKFDNKELSIVSFNPESIKKLEEFLEKVRKYIADKT